MYRFSLSAKLEQPNKSKDLLVEICATPLNPWIPGKEDITLNGMPPAEAEVNQRVKEGYIGLPHLWVYRRRKSWPSLQAERVRREEGIARRRSVRTIGAAMQKEGDTGFIRDR